MPSEAERRAKKLAEMTQEIGLNADQAQKAEGIIKNAQVEIHGIREKNDAEVDVVRMKTRVDMRTFLTPDQLPKLRRMCGEWMRRGRSRKRRRGGSLES